jgi:hypothetical protein
MNRAVKIRHTKKTEGKLACNRFIISEIKCYFYSVCIKISFRNLNNILK